MSQYAVASNQLTNMILPVVRQTADPDQGRRCRNRAHLDFSVCQGMTSWSFNHAQRKRTDAPRNSIESRALGEDSKARMLTIVRDLQALEGKDVKDLLTNVGSGGGAAAPAAGGAAAGGAAAAEEAKEEAKEEGAYIRSEWRHTNVLSILRAGKTDNPYREGGVRRGYGLRSVRLSGLHMPKPINDTTNNTANKPLSSTTIFPPALMLSFFQRRNLSALGCGSFYYASKHLNLGRENGLD